MKCMMISFYLYFFLTSKVRAMYKKKCLQVSCREWVENCAKFHHLYKIVVCMLDKLYWVFNFYKYISFQMTSFYSKVAAVTRLFSPWISPPSHDANFCDNLYSCQVLIRLESFHINIDKSSAPYHTYVLLLCHYI